MLVLLPCGIEGIAASLQRLPLQAPRAKEARPNILFAFNDNADELCPVSSLEHQRHPRKKFRTSQQNLKSADEVVKFLKTVFGPETEVQPVSYTELQSLPAAGWQAVRYCIVKNSPSPSALPALRHIIRQLPSDVYLFLCLAGSPTWGTQSLDEWTELRKLLLGTKEDGPVADHDNEGDTDDTEEALRRKSEAAANAATILKPIPAPLQALIQSVTFMVPASDSALSRHPRSAVVGSPRFTRAASEVFSRFARPGATVLSGPVGGATTLLAGMVGGWAAVSSAVSEVDSSATAAGVVSHSICQASGSVIVCAPHPRDVQSIFHAASQIIQHPTGDDDTGRGEGGNDAVLCIGSSQGSISRIPVTFKATRQTERQIADSRMAIGSVAEHVLTALHPLQPERMWTVEISANFSASSSSGVTSSGGRLQFAFPHELQGLNKFRRLAIINITADVPLGVASKAGQAGVHSIFLVSDSLGAGCDGRGRTLELLDALRKDHADVSEIRVWNEWDCIRRSLLLSWNAWSPLPPPVPGSIPPPRRCELRRMSVKKLMPILFGCVSAHQLYEDFDAKDLMSYGFGYNGHNGEPIEHTDDEEDKSSQYNEETNNDSFTILSSIVTEATPAAVANQLRRGSASGSVIDNTRFVRAVGTHPGYWRQGYGSAAVRRLVRSKQKVAYFTRCEATIRNVRFWRTCGFVPIDAETCDGPCGKPPRLLLASSGSHKAEAEKIESAKTLSECLKQAHESFFHRLLFAMSGARRRLSLEVLQELWAMAPSSVASGVQIESIARTAVKVPSSLDDWDLSRLENAIASGMDAGAIRDLYPFLAHLTFGLQSHTSTSAEKQTTTGPVLSLSGSVVIRPALTPCQWLCLVGVGLQGRSEEDVAAELRRPVDQIRVQLRLALRTCFSFVKDVTIAEATAAPTAVSETAGEHRSTVTDKSATAATA